MNTYKKSTEFRYKLMANIYDFMDTLLFRDKVGNPRLGLANQIPNSDISILDVCFGTGNSSIAIAEKNDRNKITGIDLSQDMLRVAKLKLVERNIKNVNVYFMDAANINIDEQFDIVTTSLSLHEMKKPVMDRVISEMYRVLKKDGKLYIIEWDKPQKTIGSILFMLFPFLFEPKGFGVFLRLDWESYLKKKGFKLESVASYSFTKLITATKE